MDNNWEHTYIAIDLKSFYASVECVERNLNPLTTNLVVADESRSDKTICLAVTPSLKAYGLSGRSRLFEVRQKAKEVKALTGKDLDYIIATPRMALYIKYSAKIYGIYLKYFAPEDVHVYSIDEVFIDVTQYLKYYKKDSYTLTRDVIHDILSQTGITATAGIGSNLFLCKVAMDIVAKHIKADEDGVRIAKLDEIGFRQSLWNHQPLTDFWRIGPGISRRLEKNGMFTLGDIAQRSLTEKGEKELYKIFGIDAEILIDHAWGYEPVTLKHIKSYKSKTTSLSSGQVLSEPYSFEKGKIIIKEMTHLLVLDLIEKKFMTSSISMTIGYEVLDKKNINYEGTIVKDYCGRLIPAPAHGTVNLGDATQSLDRIVSGVVYLYSAIVDPNLMIRKVNICANNLLEKSNYQPSLFSEISNEKKEDSIQNAILSIQQRFGKNAILKSISLEDGATTMERNNQIGGHKA